MFVCVKTLDGKYIRVECHPREKIILDLKMKIRDLENIKPEHQRIVFAGKHLEDGRTIGGYGIQDESTVHLVVRVTCGCWKILTGRNEGHKYNWEEGEKRFDKHMIAELGEDFRQVYMKGIKKRIFREVKSCYEQCNPENFISMKPIENSNLFNWEVILRGSKGTCFENGTFRLLVEYPPEKDYPFKPMNVYFITRIFHPIYRPTPQLVASSSAVVVDDHLCPLIPKDDWSPALQLRLYMVGIIHNLRCGPEKLYKNYSEYSEVKTGGNKEAMELLKNGKFEEFRERARYWTSNFATDSPPSIVDKDLRERIRFCSSSGVVSSSELGCCVRIQFRPESSLLLSKVFFLL